MSNATPRGLEVIWQRLLAILEEASWTIVAWPFLKFFNYGETFAETINWERRV